MRGESIFQYTQPCLSEKSACLHYITKVIEQNPQINNFYKASTLPWCSGSPLYPVLQPNSICMYDVNIANGQVNTTSVTKCWGRKRQCGQQEIANDQALRYLCSGITCQWPAKADISPEQIVRCIPTVLLKGIVPRDFLIYFFLINQLYLGTWFTGCKLFSIVSTFSELFKF